MPKAPEIKPGHVVELDGQPFIVRKVDVHSPSARGASTLYKMTFNDLVTKRKREETYKGDELLTLADAQMRTVQYLFADGDMHTFMDAEDYAQHMLSGDDLDDTLPWKVWPVWWLTIRWWRLNCRNRWCARCSIARRRSKARRPQRGPNRRILGAV